MEWHETRTGDRVTEWEREDGHATVRLRRRPDGRYVVRYDRLFQAAEGPEYRQEVVPDRESAVELAARWREDEGSEVNDADGRGDDAAGEDD
jgi:hypothetical protein